MALLIQSCVMWVAIRHWNRKKTTERWILDSPRKTHCNSTWTWLAALKRSLPGCVSKHYAYSPAEVVGHSLLGAERLHACKHGCSRESQLHLSSKSSSLLAKGARCNGCSEHKCKARHEMRSLLLEQRQNVVKRSIQALVVYSLRQKTAVP